jgi:hypothetical protein
VHIHNIGHTILPTPSSRSLALKHSDTSQTYL